MMKSTDECFRYSYLIIMSHKQCEILGGRYKKVLWLGQNGRQCDHFTVAVHYHVKCVMPLSSRSFPYHLGPAPRCHQCHISHIYVCHCCIATSTLVALYHTPTSFEHFDWPFGNLLKLTEQFETLVFAVIPCLFSNTVRSSLDRPGYIIAFGGYNFRTVQDT